jgi:hypothetical protein
MTAFRLNNGPANGLERNRHQQSRLLTIAIAHKGQRKALTRRKLVIAAF